MSTGRSWRVDRVDALLAAMSDLGVSMSRPAAGELIEERVQFVAAQMRVTPTTARTYLTDEAISGLAQSMAFGFVEETPGADLFAAQRDATIPVRLAGRVSTGLAEAARIRLAEREDLEHVRESVAQLAHAQGVLGLVMADQIAQDVEGEPWIRAPRALLHRLARYLEAAAGWWRTASSATTPTPLRPVVCRTRSAVTPSCCGRSPTARTNRWVRRPRPGHSRGSESARAIGTPPRHHLGLCHPHDRQTPGRLLGQPQGRSPGGGL